MKKLHYLFGILFAFALMTALFFTSVEAVCYWNPGYFEKEYTKYQVLNDVHMEMDDLLDVTHEMMDYLRGNREDLHVPTIINGEAREFFNAREIAHMEDVQGLFLAGFALRRIAFGIMTAAVLLLLFSKADVKQVLPKAVCHGTLLFFAVLAALAALISTDFTKYFIIFHKIFFRNDLWLLDPTTDLLINIVPEGFFVDTALRIALVFGGSTAVIFLICLCLHKKSKTSRIFTWLLCLSLSMSAFSQHTLAAPAWPSNISIEAEGGIVMDADSGAVLYGKNLHEAYFPASITKILTALIVIEHCDLDDIVTYSHNAVYNVEAGSSSAGIDEGDQLTVRDSLYAMMLKSANEAANGLAEHTAGSIEAFAEMMNEKAAALGCTDSHFVNPSGLNDPEHYTSAYDMALIAQAAFQNETFTEIDSTLYYDIPPTKRNPEGIRVYPGHKMLKKNTAQYYPGIIGGKTGYTSLAGNTLVTCAQRDGMKLITVVLNGHQTHYSDTKALLDFGFENFKSIAPADYDSTYADLKNDMTIAGLPTTNLSVILLDNNDRITLPQNADIADATSSIHYDLSESAPELAIAQIQYDYNGRNIGSMYLMRNERALETPETLADIMAEHTNEVIDEFIPETDAVPLSARSVPAPEEKETHFKLHIPIGFWIIFGILSGIGAVAGIIILFKIRIEKREEAERAELYAKRQKRLQDIGMSAVEFDLLMQEKRNKKQ